MIKKHLFRIGVAFGLVLLLAGTAIPFQSGATFADGSENAETNLKKRLSEMTDDELRTFLSEYVPIYKQDEKNQETLFRFFKGKIDWFDSAAPIPLTYGYTLYWTWTEEIQKGIKLYYGETPRDEQIAVRYVPTQNVFVEVPSYMGTCNCYGYAIGLHALMNPGFSDDLIVLDIVHDSVLQIAKYVEKDLKCSFFNKQCVKLTTVCPSSTILSAGKEAICVRKGYSSYDNTYDYHFMKLTSSGWLHKPGDSAILRHTVPHSASTNWLAEYTYNGTTWGKDPTVYSGSIVYIIYKANHNYSLQYTGVNYHSGTYHYYERAYICSDCGNQYGAYYIKVPCSGPPHQGPRDLEN